MINALIFAWFLRSFAKLPEDINEAIRAYREAQS